ncbi:MAG: zinc ribbon domain-containing protein [Anaerolineae bacterium]|nr:zinc ribbon domain-containing protein [Anaerolineae bacterium]
MKQKFLGGSLVMLALLAILWPYGQVKAQSSPPKLKSLLVELWPEYDRPEVLIIYRAELSADTLLPATLTFRLPGHIDSMHAVAVEQNGNLLEVSLDRITFLHEDNQTLLTFSTPAPKIQLEYYDPLLLNRENQTRRLAFQFLAAYDLETAIFEVQEPFGAEDFELTPAPNNTFAGRDGLKYHTIQVAGLAAGDTFELAATYRRDTDDLAAQQPAGNTSLPSQTSPATGAVTGQELNRGYLLIGGGILLLLAGGGYWWWLSRKQAEVVPWPAKSAQPGWRKKRVKPGRTPSKPSVTVGFCYRCGAALREDANFCHACGAERRQT